MTCNKANELLNEQFENSWKILDIGGLDNETVITGISVVLDLDVFKIYNEYSEDDVIDGVINRFLDDLPYIEDLWDIILEKCVVYDYCDYDLDGPNCKNGYFKFEPEIVNYLYNILEDKIEIILSFDYEPVELISKVK